MADSMMFPNSWGEFLKDYSFKDKEEVYTNGSILIPVFRVEQMVEHYFNSAWIPVSERLPDKKGEYLVTYHPCHWETVHDVFTFVGVDTFRGKTTWAKNKFQRVTHWMPLPEPPKEVDNG